MDGSVTRSTTDDTNALQWDQCNNLVISWIHNNVSENIRNSILFVNTASEIWIQLEKRFSLTNGSRKYKLSRDLYAMKQNKLSVAEYYTKLSSLWEELDSMSSFPTITITTAEITELLKTISTFKEEGKLFQYLNGLDEKFGAQRSQLLMLSHLPTVEMAFSMI